MVDGEEEEEAVYMVQIRSATDSTKDWLRPDHKWRDLFIYLLDPGDYMISEISESVPPLHVTYVVRGDPATRSRIAVELGKPHYFGQLRIPKLAEEMDYGESKTYSAWIADTIVVHPDSLPNWLQPEREIAAWETILKLGSQPWQSPWGPIIERRLAALRRQVSAPQQPRDQFAVIIY
jgi:hypothetical protein